MSKELIRLIEPGDTKPMAALIKYVLTSFRANKPGTAFGDELDLYNAFQTSGSAYWVVEYNGVIVGGGGIYPTNGLPKGYCELVKLYIHEDLRGKGIGTKLIEKSTQTAVEMGYTHMYLETMPELILCIPLYKRMGFEFIEKPLGNSGHYDCTIWMVKELKQNNS